jgi:ATP-dependent helicase/nuclease subunit A
VGSSAPAGHPDVRAVLVQLGELAKADFQPVHAVLHWMLVGPWAGRKRLVARLGREANDPIDELINAAHAYAASSTPSLVGFLNWFDAGDGELKREAGRSDGLVRVMTVHGSKGLQAPIVILADATGNPSASERIAALDRPDEPIGGGEPRRVPMPLAKEELGRIAEAAAVAAKAEGGALAPALCRHDAGGGSACSSAARWASGKGARAGKLVRAAGELSGRGLAGRPVWGGSATMAMPPSPSGRPKRAVRHGGSAARWATAPRRGTVPPRRWRPRRWVRIGCRSAVPAGANRAEAARRGTLIHALLERLPDVAPERRDDVAARWLERQAAIWTMARAMTLRRPPCAW